MDEGKVKELVESLEGTLCALKDELGMVEPETTDLEGEAEQLMFDIGCLADDLKVENGGWIYYINQINDVKCGEIWKVRTNGEDNQKILEQSGYYNGDTGKPYIAKKISGTDGKWIHYFAQAYSGGNMKDINRKVTIYGKMDQFDKEAY